MSHETRLVEGRLSIGEHDIIVSQVSIYDLPTDTLPTSGGREDGALPGQ